MAKTWVYRRPHFRAYLRRVFLRNPVPTMHLGRIEFKSAIIRGICFDAKMNFGIRMDTDIINGVSMETTIL